MPPRAGERRDHTLHTPEYGAPRISARVLLMAPGTFRIGTATATCCSRARAGFRRAPRCLHARSPTERWAGDARGRGARARPTRECGLRAMGVVGNESALVWNERPVGLQSLFTPRFAREWQRLASRQFFPSLRRAGAPDSSCTRGGRRKRAARRAASTIIGRSTTCSSPPPSWARLGLFRSLARMAAARRGRSATPRGGPSSRRCPRSISPRPRRSRRRSLSSLQPRPHHRRRSRIVGPG